MDSSISATPTIMVGFSNVGLTVLPVVASFFQNWIGVLLPPVIDLLNKYIANEKVKFWISMGICVFFAALFNFTSISDGNWAEFLTKAAFIFTQAQIIYQSYWKNASTRVSLFGKSILK